MSHRNRLYGMSRDRGRRGRSRGAFLRRSSFRTMAVRRCIDLETWLAVLRRPGCGALGAPAVSFSLDLGPPGGKAFCESFENWDRLMGHAVEFAPVFDWPVRYG